MTMIIDVTIETNIEKGTIVRRETQNQVGDVRDHHTIEKETTRLR